MQYIASKQTIGARLKECSGITSGWDYLRLVLAIGIVLVHSAVMSYGAAARWTFFPPFCMPVINALVPMFFALSGFLVSASLLRVSLVRFIGLRILRIFPALVVEVMLSALILGPLLTTVDLKTYFQSPLFHVYFRNLYGDIHYFLPGMFAHNPYPNAVNGSLWTVPFELRCYGVLVALGLFRLVRHWALMLAVLAGFSAWMYVYSAPGNEWVLVLYFLAGVTLYSLRDVLPLRFELFVVAGTLTFYLQGPHAPPDAVYLSPLPLAYFTAWLGLRNIPKLKLIFSGDYSYGIYLYAFPLQQAVVELSPIGMRSWAFNAVFSLVLVGALATFSWHFIEQPTQRLKIYLKHGVVRRHTMPERTAVLARP